MEYKQVIVLRTDLKMSIGKAAAQASHASLSSYKKAGKLLQDKWEREGAKKVVLKANSESELTDLFEKAKRRGLPCALIKDAGHTELEPGTITALGIGPEKSELIDKVTGNLPLLD